MGPALRRQVTRADVARLAGVSTAVVSYVINDGPGAVAPATRVRVLEAISALGYQPNAAARALATGSSRLLGLVVPDISNPLFGEFAVSIERAAAERGYAVLLASSEMDEATERRHVTNLVARRVDGILLSSVLPYPDLSAPRNSDTRVVLLNAFRPHPGIVTVGIDAYEGARLATAHLIEHGHTVIGLIIGRANSSDLEAREAGWLDAISSRGLTPGPIVRTEFTRAGGYEATYRLFGSGNGPSAVFVSADLQAIGALSALHELGISVPEHVAVVSFDGTEESQYSIPALTTVRQPVDNMSKKLLDLVLDAAAPTDMHSSFPTELVVRASCGAHPAS